GRLPRRRRAAPRPAVLPGPARGRPLPRRRQLHARLRLAEPAGSTGMNAAFDSKAYNRALAKYSLLQQKTPSTAAEIAEHMVTVAQSEGLPQEVLRETHPSAVFGILRALENEGFAARVGERKN